MDSAIANKRRTFQFVIVLAVITSGALVLSSLLIVPYLTTNNAIQNDSQRRIIAFETTSVPRTGVYDENGELMYDTIVDFRYIKAGDLEPNSLVWILNPFDNVASELYAKKPLVSLTNQEKKDALQKIDR